MTGGFIFDFLVYFPKVSSRNSKGCVPVHRLSGVYRLAPIVLYERRALTKKTQRDCHGTVAVNYTLDLDSNL